MFDLITIGDSSIDNIVVIDDQEAKLQCDIKKDSCLLCLNYADKIGIKKTGQAIGGNAANLAVGCKKLGLKTALVTELGDDINGHIIKHELEQSGINTQLVKILPKKETRFNVILNYQSERTVLSYYADRNYSLPRLPKTKWFYYTSLGKTFTKLQKQLIIYLKKHPEIKLAVNPGSYQMKHGLKKFKDILSFAEIIFLNKQEAEHFVGKKNIKASLTAWQQLGVKIVVITNGINGAYATDGQTSYHLDIYPLKPKFKTGAGDAFASGFLSAILHKKNIETAMQWGMANAGSVVQAMGAQNGLQNQTSLNKIINKFKQIKPKKI